MPLTFEELTQIEGIPIKRVDLNNILKRLGCPGAVIRSGSPTKPSYLHVDKDLTAGIDHLVRDKPYSQTPLEGERTKKWFNIRWDAPDIAGNYRSIRRTNQSYCGVNQLIESGLIEVDAETGLTAPGLNYDHSCVVGLVEPKPLIIGFLFPQRYAPFGEYTIALLNPCPFDDPDFP